jgi:hypothetical protein
VTTPKVNTIKRGDSRFYVHPETAAKVPGVTSVVGMLPKPFLTFWAAKMVAEYAVDNLGETVGIAMRDRQAAVDLLKGAPRRSTAGSAEVGTAVHDLFERLAKGETVGRVHPDYRSYVEHFEEFLAEFEPEFLFMEETVWNGTVGYAGSFDAIAKIGGETLVLDWKTTKSGVHAEVAIQLASYRHAEYLVRPDGTRVPMPKIDGGAVLHVRPEGWGLYPVRCDEEIFEFQKHLREVFRWDKEVKDTVVGNPVNKNPNKVGKKTATPRTRTARGAS